MQLIHKNQGWRTLEFNVKKEHFLLAVIGVLLLTNVLAIIDSKMNYNVAAVVVEGWQDREDYLIDLCQIDYNQYLIDQRDEKIREINELMNVSG